MDRFVLPYSDFTPLTGVKSMDAPIARCPIDKVFAILDQLFGTN